MASIVGFVCQMPLLKNIRCFLSSVIKLVHIRVTLFKKTILEAGNVVYGTLNPNLNANPNQFSDMYGQRENVSCLF